ncbi:MAG TPA: hypothetical protein VLS49_13215 [Usitatibacter sp.]|nr:hypothetical protein [Usitatibacter sp.]
MMHKAFFAIALALAAGAAIAGFGPGAPGSGADTTQTPAFDTSYAVEASYSCLEGGCHATDGKLVSDYAASYMTHVMVKCNACHGTHTPSEVGRPKPHLTGYFAGIGAAGYTVGKDRCLACHSAVSGGGHPNNPAECKSCHAPHVFRR